MPIECSLLLIYTSILLIFPLTVCCLKLHPSRCDMLDNNCASTLIGQCLEVLNNEAQPIDEFNLENFPVGNLECNVEEVCWLGTWYKIVMIHSIDIKKYLHSKYFELRMKSFIDLIDLCTGLYKIA